MTTFHWSCSKLSRGRAGGLHANICTLSTNIIWREISLDNMYQTDSKREREMGARGVAGGSGSVEKDDWYIVVWLG